MKPAKTFRRSWSNNWAVQNLYAVNAQPLATQGDNQANAQPLATQGDNQADNQPDTRSGKRHRPHAHGAHRTRVH
jgi:hypothetical protein